MKTNNKVISKFGSKTILVIGDVILDRYVQGNVSRISPEAPVPVVLEEKSFYTPGGAANVSYNLSALGAKVVQVGKIGNDFEGQILKRQLKKQKIDVHGIFVDKDMPTVTKTRIIAQHQQVVRIDREKVNDSGNKSVNQKIKNFIQKNIDAYDAIIISDYGKGLITSELLGFVKDLALLKKKIITVDPKVENFEHYRNVTGITPNKKEAENAIRDIKIKGDHGKTLNIKQDKLLTSKLVDQAGKQLLNYLKLDSLLITLGEDGMRLFEKGKTPVAIKTQAREVFDVTGAGDAVISVFTLCLAAGATKRQAAQLANVAGGIVVGKLGAVAVTKEELQKAIKR